MVQLNVKYVSMVECSVRRAVFCEAVLLGCVGSLIRCSSGINVQLLTIMIDELILN